MKMSPKCSIVVLFSVLVVEVLGFANLVFASQVNAEALSANATPTVVVFDRIASPIGKIIPEIKEKDQTRMVISEAGPIAEEPEVEYDAWLSSEPEVQTPSYDGGGYVDANVDGTWISGSDFAWMGVHYDSGSGYSYTYYSENVLPGGGLSIPGRHVGDEGYVMDGNGNLCLASDDLPYGTVVNVPFGSGTGVVYDCGSGYGNLDVYVSW